MTLTQTTSHAARSNRKNGDDAESQTFRKFVLTFKKGHGETRINVFNEQNSKNEPLRYSDITITVKSN